MLSVASYLVKKQAELAAHPFFSRLEQNHGSQRELAFASGLTFWVFTFQDVLRLNESRVTDPALARVARHHRVEDSGHDAWFLQDVAVLDPTPRDVPWLFGAKHAQTRDAAYALMSEVFRATNDHVRVALLLTLESAGHVFFERVADYVHATGMTDELRYFSHHHLEVEKDHSMFEDETRADLDVELPAEVHAETMAMIDRCYQAFIQLFDGLEARLARQCSGTHSIPGAPDGAQRTRATG
ncbi:MAG: hypothetical protein WKG00_15430 [Polyangiaceae bacterium]